MSNSQLLGQSSQNPLSGETRLIVVAERVLGLERGKLQLIITLDEVGRGCIAGPVVTAASAWARLCPRDALLEKSLTEQTRLLSQVRDSKKLTEKKRIGIYVEHLALLHGEPTAPPPPSSSISFGSGANGLDPTPLISPPDEIILRYGADDDLSSPRKKQAPSGGFSFSSEPETAQTELSAEEIDYLSKEEALFLIDTVVTGASSQEVDEFGILVAINLAMNRAILNLAESAAKALDLTIGDLPELTLIVVDGDQPIKLPAAFLCMNQAIVVGGDDRLRSVGLPSVIAKVSRDALMVRLEDDHPGYGFAKHKGYGTQAHYEALREKGVSPEHRRSFNLGQPKRSS